MKKGFYKIFGKGGRTNKRVITATTFEGTHPVKVYYPKRLTGVIKRKVGDFLIHELDDPKSYKKFKKKHK